MKKINGLTSAASLIIAAIPILFCWPGIPENVLSPTTSVYAQKGYKLSQDYIDSTILRSIYVINEAATFAGVGYRHKEAITKARRILNNLKEKAKGDPNESYVMWKVREVEGQIQLELEELRQIEAEKNQLTSNRLVLEYNAEVGQKRPDFATLRGIFMRMSEVDVRQANNLASSYNQRYRNISREAMYSLQKALMKGDVDLAKSELDYVEKNKYYLVISPRRLETLKAKYEKLRSALDEVPNIEKELADGDKAAREFKLSKSRSSLNRAKGKLNRLKESLPQKKWVSLSSQTDRHIRFLDNREDSLVKVTMKILEQKGPDAAGEYFQNVLQKMGLSRDKCSYIDNAILDSTPKDSEPETRIVGDLHVEEDNQKSEVLSNMRQIAKKRAKEKADSIKAAEEAKQRMVSLSGQSKSKQNSRKPDPADRQKSVKKTGLQTADLSDRGQTAQKTKPQAADTPNSRQVAQKTKPQVPDSPDSRQATQKTKPQMASPEDDQHYDSLIQMRIRYSQDRAAQISVDIYDLLEKSKYKEAKLLFSKERPFLHQYLFNDSYEMLELSIKHCPDESTAETKQVAKAETKQAAKAETKQAAKAETKQAAKAETKQAAKNPSDNEKLKREKNEKIAKKRADIIYALLEQNKIKEAYHRFQKDKKPLSRYLDKNSFEMLEITVVQSYNYLSD